MENSVHIFSCPECGQMFKITDLKNENGSAIMVTDFNEHIEIKDSLFYCRKHNKLVNITKANFMKTFDWVADLVFTIKGE